MYWVCCTAIFSRTHMDFDKVSLKRPYLGFYKSYQTKVATFWIAQILCYNCVENTKNHFLIRKKVIEQIAKKWGIFQPLKITFLPLFFYRKELAALPPQLLVALYQSFKTRYLENSNRGGSMPKSVAKNLKLKIENSLDQRNLP